MLPFEMHQFRLWTSRRSAAVGHRNAEQGLGIQAPAEALAHPALSRPRALAVLAIPVAIADCLTLSDARVQERMGSTTDSHWAEMQAANAPDMLQCHRSSAGPLGHSHATS